MTIPSSEVPPGEDFGSTLEQFRRALASEVGRERLGIDIDANEAASIATDAEQSARWHAVWRTSVRDHPRTGADIIVPAPPRKVRKQRDDWQRHLPVRFNPPPGWPAPSQDWILQHIGLEMSDAWRPPGAPPYDPPGWLWWIPQEPAWTEWMTQHKRDPARVRAFAVAFGVFVGLACSLPFAGWVLGSLLAIVCAFGSGVGLMQAIASLRHFHRDPLGELHDNHTQVSERLSYGATVGDGHHIDFGDFADFGGSFDGE